MKRSPIPRKRKGPPRRRAGATIRPYRLPKRFDAVNEERHRLLDRKYSKGLSKAEAERLKAVSDEVSEMLRPFNEAGIKRLQQMKRQTDAAMKKLDKITEKYGLRSKRKGPPRRRAGACREYLDWLKTQPCVITGRRAGWDVLREGDGTEWGWRHVVDPFHIRVKRLGGDLNNAISVEHTLHSEWHQIGRHSWCEKYGQTWEGLLELARRQTEQFLEQCPVLGA